MIAWLKLLRIALIPTVVLDFFTGVWLADLPIANISIPALTALILIYHGSMALNDWRDQEVDKEANRKRPLTQGLIPSNLALGFGLLSYIFAWTICQYQAPLNAELCTWLIFVVLAYNFSPIKLRTHIGPALLATARSFSLVFGASALVGPEKAFLDITYPAIMSYALFFLFLSRLASHEEEGLPRLKAMTFLSMASTAPLLLFIEIEFTLHYLLAISLFLAFCFSMLKSVIVDKNVFLEPKHVQLFVRHGLSHAPLVLGLALLRESVWIGAAASLLAVILVKNIAQKIPPE